MQKKYKQNNFRRLHFYRQNFNTEIKEHRVNLVLYVCIQDITTKTAAQNVMLYMGDSLWFDVVNH